LDCGGKSDATPLCLTRPVIESVSPSLAAEIKRQLASFFFLLAAISFIITR
jgi:hypothetical protein